MEKFTLINKARSRIKVFETFDDSAKNPSMINAILISLAVFLIDHICQLLKTLELNLSKKLETNIKNIRGRVRKKL